MFPNPNFELACQLDCFLRLLEELDIVVDMVVNHRSGMSEKTLEQRRSDDPTNDFLGIGYYTVTTNIECTILPISESELWEIPKEFRGKLS